MSLPLGLGEVHPMSATEVLDFFAENGRAPRIIANLNLHGLYLREVNSQFRAYCEGADVVLVDGFPVLVLAMIGASQHIESKRRIGSTDWVIPLIELDSSIRVVAVGGSAHTATKASLNVNSRTANMSWLAYDGFDFSFCSEGPEVSLTEALRGADLVLVGMGMPFQEQWIVKNLDLAPNATFANVGGLFDYLGGAQRLAPRWIGSLGLEWAYRVALAPRRLGKRYFVEPIKLARFVCRRLLL